MHRAFSLDADGISRGENENRRFHDTNIGQRREIWTHSDIAEITVNRGG